MEMKMLPIDEIVPATYNPRKDLQPEDEEYQKIKRSIETYGFVEPIVWNKRTKRIVGGHQRFKVIQDLGYEEILVSIVDIDETQEKLLNIALNKISGKWDNLKLKDVLEEIDTGEVDLELTGFDIDEIEDLMTQFYDPSFEPATADEQGDLDVIEKTIYKCPRCENEFES